MTSNVHEAVLHEPLALEAETGETVYFACLGRREGQILHEIIRRVLSGTIQKALLLDIADMGGCNQYYMRLLRGFVKAALFERPGLQHNNSLNSLSSRVLYSLKDPDSSTRTKTANLSSSSSFSSSYGLDPK